MTETTYTTAALFTGKDKVVQTIYNYLLEALHTFGPFQEDPKKISIHLTRTFGFAGVHPHKSYLYLNIRTDYLINSLRIA